MTDTKPTLRGQVAVVTGAARGIGHGIAARLAREGASVVIWDRDVAAFDASAAGFEPAAVIMVDVADFASVERGMAATMAHAGRLDILVNNAGVNGPVAPVWEYPLASHVRAVLHHQAHRPGNGTRPRNRLWNRQTEQRVHLGLQ